MRKVYLFVSVFISLFLISCAENSVKKVQKSKFNDVSVKIVDKSFDFSKVKSIIIYSVHNNSDEIETLNDLKKILSKNNFSVIIDSGQSLDYGDENMRIRTSHKLMSLVHIIYFLKGGQSQIKGNEDIIAVIKADSSDKVAKVALNLLKKR